MKSLNTPKLTSCEIYLLHSDENQLQWKCIFSMENDPSRYCLFLKISDAKWFIHSVFKDKWIDSWSTCYLYDYESDHLLEMFVRAVKNHPKYRLKTFLFHERIYKNERFVPMEFYDDIKKIIFI